MSTRGYPWWGWAYPIVTLLVCLMLSGIDLDSTLDSAPWVRPAAQILFLLWVCLGFALFCASIYHRLRGD